LPRLALASSLAASVCLGAISDAAPVRQELACLGRESSSPRRSKSRHPIDVPVYFRFGTRHKLHARRDWLSGRRPVPSARCTVHSNPAFGRTHSEFRLSEPEATDVHLSARPIPDSLGCHSNRVCSRPRLNRGSGGVGGGELTRAGAAGQRWRNKEPQVANSANRKTKGTAFGDTTWGCPSLGVNLVTERGLGT